MKCFSSGISYHRTSKICYQIIKFKHYYLTNKQIFAELKAADCRLQLDIIKRHIPPKNCSQRCEIKF